jgi:sulfate adenylyltransferase
MTTEIKPHGGKLNNLYCAPYLPELSIDTDLPGWTLTTRQRCDLELLLNGAFSPLRGFLGKSDYDSVVEKMHLSDGILWPMPITLDITRDYANKIDIGHTIALRDRGITIALLEIEEIWSPDKIREATRVYGSTDVAHPGVRYLLREAGEVYIAGKLTGVSKVNHDDYPDLRHTPNELRRIFHSLGWQRVIAFQTRNPMHRAHQELTIHAAHQAQANLLLHPVVGLTKPGDIEYKSRVRCYQRLLPHYPVNTAMLSLLPLAMRMAGPREAVWHAIIRQNYGCTHFIIGRDHAGPGKNSDGEDFYGPYDAQSLLREVQNEIEIQMVPFEEYVYVKEKNEYLPASKVEASQTVLSISGTEFRRRLQAGDAIPSWFSYPEVVEELAAGIKGELVV